MVFDEQLLAQTNVAFRFVVEVNDKPWAAFTECTLPVIDWEVEEIKEGGLNTSIHQLPGRRKSARLTLKNGVGRNELWNWCIDVMAEKFERRKIEIQLLDTQGKPFAVWQITEAYPIKWTGPQLKTDANAVAIQTIEFACGEIVVDMKPAAN